MPTLSLHRCVNCHQVTGDASPSRRDGEPRCPPCERRADHTRRLIEGDRWYRERIVAYAERVYGPGWEHERGWVFCADLFADVRALGGWQAVGVDTSEWSSRRKPIETRRCPRCGETTTSSTDYFCAGCHFRGWWGRWAALGDARKEPPAA